ncbi:MAG TPA: hypothetical protein ENJ09_03565, partial [Planctomycetes bacterium]|nr:hypothetical protein [Planctomycetota bacterium]
VVGLKENTTRKGKKMARFRLEDLQGGVNVTVFPRTYAECRELLEEDRILICRGKLEERDDDDRSAVGLLLNQVMDVEEAIENFRGGLVVSLTPQDEPRLDELAELLEGHRGDKRLFLEIEGRDGKRWRVRAGERHRVAISSRLATDVEKLIGKGKAKLARI